MKTESQILHVIAAICLFFASLVTVRCQETNRTNSQFTENAGAMEKLRQMTYVPPEYRAEVERKIIEEANKVASELQLAESLPITVSNVISEYIPPPKLAGALNALGNITTSNYTYS